MSVKLGDVVPDFTAETTQGRIRWHEYIEGRWAMLMSHPADFTPVCTTELAAAVCLAPEFQRRGVRVLALSCDAVASHLAWAKDIAAMAARGPGGAADSAADAAGELPFAIAADPDRAVATAYGMLDPAERDAQGVPLAARAVFIVGPDKTLRLSILYPATTGRNFAEILRALDSLMLTVNYSVATPADWKHGEPCMVLPSLSASQASQMFPKGFSTVRLPSGKPYLRITPQPDV